MVSLQQALGARRKCDLSVEIQDTHLRLRVLLAEPLTPLLKIKYNIGHRFMLSFSGYLGHVVVVLVVVFFFQSQGALTISSRTSGVAIVKQERVHRFLQTSGGGVNSFECQIERKASIRIIL